jgi:hypothetical protein
MLALPFYLHLLVYHLSLDYRHLHLIETFPQWFLEFEASVLLRMAAYWHIQFNWILCISAVWLHYEHHYFYHQHI